MRKRLLLVVIFGIFFFLSAGYHVGTPSISKHGLPDRLHVVSYTQHSPITITSNTDFEAQGWPGNGTKVNPYIIDGLNITSDSVCINITDTTAHFEIRNCIISASSLSDYDGIYFKNVTHGTVEGCVFEFHENGLSVSYSSNCIFTNNNATDNSVSGFRFSYSNSCIITGNLATRNSWYGFFYDNSLYCNLTNNVAISNFHGFLLATSDFLIVQNNTVTGHAHGILIRDNSVHNLLFLNRIYDNSQHNGYDLAGPNSWDNGSHGNYWGDYIGNGNYSVPGVAGSVDRYPFAIDYERPTIDGADDLEYELGTTGHSIAWTLYDLHLHSYVVYKNGTVIKSGGLNYTSETITIWVDGLDRGSCNYTIVVNDTNGHIAVDTVIVTVVPLLESSTSNENQNANPGFRLPDIHLPDIQEIEAFFLQAGAFLFHVGIFLFQLVTDYRFVGFLCVCAIGVAIRAAKRHKRWREREIRNLLDEAQENLDLIDRAGKSVDSDYLRPEKVARIVNETSECIHKALSIAENEGMPHWVEKAKELKTTLRTKHGEALDRFEDLSSEQKDAFLLAMDERRSPADGVEVLRGCAAIGGVFEYKVKIQNGSPYVITNVKSNIVSYPEDSLVLTGDATRQVSRIEVGGFRSLLFRFVPTMDCVEGKVMATVSFLDFRDEVHSFEVRPYVIKSVCDLLKPLNADPKEFGLMLNEMQSSKEELVVDWNPEVLFVKAKRMLVSKNFRVISSEEETADGHYVATIHALAEGKYTEKKLAAVVVITGQQEGSQSQVMIEVKGDDVSMLPTTIQELQEDVKSWTCLRCGSPLSPEMVSLILRGNSVKCEHCGARIDSSSYERKGED